MKHLAAHIALVVIMSAVQSGCYGCYSPPSANLAAAIIASRDLAPGVTIQEADIRIIKTQSSNLPPLAPRRKSDVLGHKTLVPIAKGQFILTSGLSRQAQIN